MGTFLTIVITAIVTTCAVVLVLMFMFGSGMNR